ncbi:hypothetical protein MUP00_09015 [Candidatus Bathyarchaeota archaeon]|nr:hypothetical protein [Candidatus Bathyarchaeota archaeon]
MDNITKCDKCGEWLIAEQVPNHRCLVPRYFFGPEIDASGNMFHYVSEDGQKWVRKLLSDDWKHPRQSDEEGTVPSTRECKCLLPAKTRSVGFSSDL